MKKVLVMMMCVIMVVCFMPTVAMAETLPAKDANNVITLDKDYNVDSLTVEENITYDLKGHTLTYNGNNAINVGNGQTLTFMDSTAPEGQIGQGKLVFSSKSNYTLADIVPQKGGTVNAHNITIESPNSVFLPLGDAAAVNVTNCKVIAGCYCVGTNAKTVENYNVVITLTNSIFTAANNDNDNCPVMINVPGTLNIDGCTITGQRQGVMVRAGNATIQNSTIKTLGGYSNKDQYHSGNWSSGNEVPAAGLVVGNHNNTAYAAAANVTLTNTTVAGENDFPAVYIDANDTYEASLSVSGGNTDIGKIIKTDANKTSLKITGGTFSDLGVLEYAQDNANIALSGNVSVNNKITIDKPVTIDGNGHTISAADGFKKDKQGHLMLLQSNVTMKNLTLDSKSKANGINTYGTDKSLQINFENVKMLNSAGNGLTAKGGTITLKNVEISGSAWKQSVDISASNDYSNGANLVVDRYCSFGDQVAVVFDNPGDGAKVGNVTSADPSRLIISSSDETKDWSEKGETPYTKRVFTFTRISADNGITLPPTTPTDNITNSGTSGTDNATTSADLSGSTSTSNGTTTSTVDKTTADKIVDKAVENKSTEVVIDATAKTTAASASTTTAQVTIPTATLGDIAEKTEADITVKTDVAEIKIDNATAAAVAEQAEGDTVKIVAEKVKEDAAEVHFELKVVCSDGKVISDFKGGNVTVTVALPKAMADKKVVCVYIDDNGHMSKMEGQKNANGTYTFVTGHFSSYAILAEEEADAAIAAQKEAIKNIKIKLTSKQVKTKAGKKAVKITWTADAGDKVLDGVEVFRSTERYKGYGTEPFYTSTKGGNTGSYTNTKSLKKGTKYYYRVRGYVLVDGQKVYTDYSTKAWRTVK